MKFYFDYILVNNNHFEKYSRNRHLLESIIGSTADY